MAERLSEIVSERLRLTVTDEEIVADAESESDIDTEDVRLSLTVADAEWDRLIVSV